MQVSVEELDNPLERKISICIPSEWIDLEVDKKIQEQAKHYKMPGFRPGKVPGKVLQKRLGPFETLNYLDERFPLWLTEALKLNDLRVAGFTSIDMAPHERGKQYQFSVTAEIMPDIPDAAYENLSFVVNESEVKEQHVQERLEQMAIKSADYVEVRAADAAQHRITMQYRDGENPDQDFTPELYYYLDLNSREREFDKMLKGVRSGDILEIDWDYHTLFEGYVPDEAEEKKKSLILINHVESPKEAPQVNDELAEKLGIEEGGLKELAGQVRSELEWFVRQSIDKPNLNHVQDALFKRNETSGAIPIPRSMYLSSGAFFLGKPVLNEANIPEMDESRITYLRKNVLYHLVVNRIHERFKFDLDENKIKEYVASQAGNYQDPEMYAQNVMRDKEQVFHARFQLRQLKAIEKILETAITKTEYLDLDQLLSASPHMLRTARIQQKPNIWTEPFLYDSRFI